MKVLTIERSKWQRGDHPDTALLNYSGKMCCLGFDAIACGVPSDAISGVGEPSDIGGVKGWPDYFESRINDDAKADLVNAAIGHNDDANIDEETREHLIRKDLIALGWDDVVFVD